MSYPIRQKEPSESFRGAPAARVKQAILADTELDITTKSIASLSDVYSSMSPSDGEVLTYDTTNKWQSEAIPAVNITKSGATQAAASASAGELWFTSGHATLPDNVVMWGV